MYVPKVHDEKPFQIYTDYIHISDDFGLRSPVIQKTFQAKSATFLVAPVVCLLPDMPGLFIDNRRAPHTATTACSHPRANRIDRHHNINSERPELLSRRYRETSTILSCIGFPSLSPPLFVPAGVAFLALLADVHHTQSPTCCSFSKHQ